ncbi:MAG: PAS domain-containing protein [Haloarculaceae archaeon]
MADRRLTFSERVAVSGSDIELDEEVFNAVVSTAVDSLNDVVYFIDSTGSLVTWNDAVLELTGYTDEEVADLSPLDFFEDEDRERIERNIRRVLDEGQAVIQADLVTRDGETIPMEFVSTRLTDEEGRPIGLVGIGRQLAHSHRLEEQYRSILDRMADAFLALDADWQITYLNDRAREALSLGDEAVVGEDIRELFPQAAESKAIDYIQRAMDEQEPTTYERYSEPVGAWIEARVYPDEDGVSVFFRDISDRVHRERSLERQNQRLEEFASMVSHDLRNPLNVATARLNMVREERDDEHLKAAADALDRIETIVDEMLELAQEGQTIDDPEPVDLASVARDAWTTVETLEATLAVESDLGTVEGDRPRLRRAFENLFRNAVEHAGSTTTVTIGSLPDGFYVEDDGPGFDVDPEQALEHGYSTQVGGTGLGLSIVAGIVDAHGWMLEVTDAEDGGARFEIRF